MWIILPKEFLKSANAKSLPEGGGVTLTTGTGKSLNCPANFQLAVERRKCDAGTRIRVFGGVDSESDTLGMIETIFSGVLRVQGVRKSSKAVFQSSNVKDANAMRKRLHGFSMA